MTWTERVIRSAQAAAGCPAADRRDEAASSAASDTSVGRGARYRTSVYVGVRSVGNHPEAWRRRRWPRVERGRLHRPSDRESVFRRKTDRRDLLDPDDVTGRLLETRQVRLPELAAQERRHDDGARATRRAEALARRAPVRPPVPLVEGDRERDRQQQRAKRTGRSEPEPGCGVPGRDADGGGNDRQDRVSDDDVVGARERERDRSADRDDRQAARHESATPQLRRRTSQKQDEPDCEQRGREDAAHDLRRKAVADGEALRDARDSHAERGVRHRLPRSTLVEDERQVGETDSRREAPPPGPQTGATRAERAATPPRAGRERRRSSASRARARPRAPSREGPTGLLHGERARRRAPCTAARSANRLYARASCAYQTRNGWTLTRAAAMTPTRRETRAAPAP